MGTLAAYGEAGEPSFAPQLPARLGEVTGADATLYVGGWAYLAPRRESTGEKVAKGVVIALAVVAVVAIVAVVASGLSSKDSKSSGSKSRRGGASFREDREEAIANVRDHRGRATIRDHRDGARGGGGRISTAGFGGSRIRDHRTDGRTLVRDSRDPRYPRYRRTETGVDIVIDALAEAPAPPPSGQSRLFLQMTLVDNRTGGVLWHAHQTFPANPAQPGDAARAAEILLASLPAR